MATEHNTPPTPPTPPTPTVPATPDTQEQSNTQNAKQSFIHNDQNISMQIIGETPEITDHPHAALNFTVGSYIDMAIQGASDTPIFIRWDSSGCVATQAGESRSCGSAERQQIISLIWKLPTPPVPPSS